MWGLILKWRNVVSIVVVSICFFRQVFRHEHSYIGVPTLRLETIGAKIGNENESLVLNANMELSREEGVSEPRRSAEKKGTSGKKKDEVWFCVLVDFSLF